MYFLLNRHHRRLHFKTQQSTVVWDIMVVCTWDHTEHFNTISGQNAEHLTVSVSFRDSRH